MSEPISKKPESIDKSVSDDTSAQTKTNKKYRTLGLLMVAIAAMGTLGANAPFLYETFCKVTGYGGTTRVAEAAPDTILDREVTVRFNTSTFNGLEWEFEPEQRDISVKLGQNALVYYRVKNLSNEAVNGIATYNVTPVKAGPYFSKIECFCFTGQRLEAGEEKVFPVLFFVDPLMDEEKRMDSLKSITLSYIFMPVDEYEKENSESLN